MSVHSFRELPRVNSHRLGESPQFERRFVLTLNDPNTNSGVMVTTVGATHGSAHPETASASCYDVEVNEAYEGSRYHAELIARYEIPLNDNEYSLLPWQRPDKWSFVTQGVAVPALFYYDGTTQKPLVNSAGDYFEGLLVDEGQQKIIIESNRQAFPSALAAAVTNAVNNGAYLGFPADHVKVQGISGEQAQEEINGQTVRYWKIKSELLGRQSGWNLLLPDIGFNFIAGGVKKRAFVKGPPPDEAEVATTNPIGLNGSGAQVTGGTLPAILNRRVYKQITMSQYFGTPPS
jgi:hypothetical protein